MKDSKIEGGTKDVQLREYEQQLFCYFRPCDKIKPNLIYANKNWINTNFKLPEDVSTYISELKSFRNSPSKMLTNIKKVFTSITGKQLSDAPETMKYQYNIQLTSLLERYWKYQDQLLDIDNKGVIKK